MTGEETNAWRTWIAILFVGLTVTFMCLATRANESLPLETLSHHGVDLLGVADEKKDVVAPYTINPYEWEELARYIFRYKTRHDGGIWNICGHSLNHKEMRVAALEYAKELLIAHNTTMYPIRRGGVKYVVKVPLRGVLGTMMSESRLDYCALGPNPRKWAYEKGLLEKRPEGQRGTPSYSQEDILMVLNHPKWNKRLADLGLAQIVWGRTKRAIYQGEPEDLLSLRPGIKKVFEEMADRGRRKNSRRPWEYWPGERRHTWYDIRVTRFERAIFSPPLADY